VGQPRTISTRSLSLSLYLYLYLSLSLSLPFTYLVLVERGHDDTNKVKSRTYKQVPSVGEQTTTIILAEERCEEEYLQTGR